MLINSVGGGGEKEAEAVAYASSSAPFSYMATSTLGVAPVPGDPVPVHYLFSRTVASQAEPDYVYGQGYIGYTSWGYVFLRFANLLGEGVEATFVTPEGSAFGAGKKIRVRFYVDAYEKDDEYWRYYLMVKVLESEVTSPQRSVFQTRMYYAKENLVLE